MSETTMDKPAPHYHGHRDRLRERFKAQGATGIQDYELLELILFRAIPRRDVKPIAKALLHRFGDLGRVCAADLDQLCAIEGISERTALDIKLVHAAAIHITKGQVSGRPVISSWSALLDYCRASLQHASTEEFRTLYLDKKNRLIADEFHASGTVDHAPVYPREVVKRALSLNATAMILVHNHPSGDPTPSQADITMTREIKDAAKPFGIVLHDHLVVGRDNIASFKRLGLL
nr:DNA repair protein RadC [Woodsholea maritima]